MIRVKVYAPAWCNVHALDEHSYVNVPEGSTLTDVLALIGMPKLAAKLFHAAVNSEAKPLNTVLKDGDMISFFAMLAGG